MGILISIYKYLKWKTSSHFSRGHKNGFDRNFLNFFPVISAVAQPGPYFCVVRLGPCAKKTASKFVTPRESPSGGRETIKYGTQS